MAFEDRMSPEYTDTGNRKPTDVPANELVKALSGIDFPANKDKMVKHAQENNAPQTVIEAIRKLPSKDYQSPTDVTQRYGEIQDQGGRQGQQGNR